ncbi:MAG: hypothetical protein U5L10_05395 [Candidatus Moranbacteria bacterium]|nr:hypothetical protein [Candidatus Moranbacteria bacterium]
MEEFLEKLRKKPRAYRQKLALLLTGVFAVVICFFWIIISTHKVQNTIEKTTNLSETVKGGLPSLKERRDQLSGQQEDQQSGNNSTSEDKAGNYEENSPVSPSEEEVPSYRSLQENE